MVVQNYVRLTLLQHLNGQENVEKCLWLSTCTLTYFTLTTKYVWTWRLFRTTTKSFFANQSPEDTLCMPKARLIATAAEPNNGLKFLKCHSYLPKVPILYLVSCHCHSHRHSHNDFSNLYLLVLSNATMRQWIPPPLFFSFLVFTAKKWNCSFDFWENLRRPNLLTVLSDPPMQWVEFLAEGVFLCKLKVS